MPEVESNHWSGVRLLALIAFVISATPDADLVHTLTWRPRAIAVNPPEKSGSAVHHLCIDLHHGTVHCW